MDAVQKAQLGPSGHADGARAARVRAVHARDAPQPAATRSGRTATASSCRPGTPRCCCTRRCTWPATTDARATSSTSASSARTPPGTPSTATPRGSRRPPARSARASRTAVGFALAERMLAARFNRPGHEVVDHHTFVIASDGDIEEGITLEASSLAGHLGLGRLIAFYDATTSRSRAIPTLALHRGRRRCATRPTAGTSRTSARTSRSTRSRGRPRAAMAVEDRPSLIIVPHPHRLRQPAQAGHRRGARLAARRGGGAADQGGLRLAIRTSSSTSPTRRSSTSAAAVERGERVRSAEWEERFEAYRDASPAAAPRSSSDWSERSCPPAGTTDAAAIPRLGTMIATRKSSHEVLQWAAAQRPRAGRRRRPTWRPRR